ncbi:MAG: hypothetical protein R2800_11700 [Flavipsychrobacter sp.]
MRSFALLFILSFSLLGCQNIVSVDCKNVPAPTKPVETARFRIFSDANNEDLLANNTLSLDSLVAIQPCNMNDTLQKTLLSYNNGYQFYFNDIRQPVVGENTECYDIILKWNSGITDKLTFTVTAEHTECHTIYSIARVTYNNVPMSKQDGYYALRR